MIMRSGNYILPKKFNRVLDIDLLSLLFIVKMNKFWIFRYGLPVYNNRGTYVKH